MYCRKYTVFSDVWSYGCQCVLYEIWSLGCKPFEDITNVEVHICGYNLYLCSLFLFDRIWRKLGVDTGSHLLLVVLELYTD